MSSQPITTITSPNPNLLDNRDLTNLINRKGVSSATKAYVDSQKQQVTHVADATDDDIAAQFNTLLSTMQAAGLMA